MDEQAENNRPGKPLYFDEEANIELNQQHSSPGDAGPGIQKNGGTIQ